MKYKLIFIEGLPGTGKTTLSERIHELLTSQNTLSELLIEESEKIPSNFSFVAGIPRIDFTGFSIEKAIIKETNNYVFADLRKCTEEEAMKLLRYDVGNEYNKQISSQEYARCTLEWWQSWVINNINESVLILDSAFMQCPINEMIFRGSTDSEVTSYIQAIAEIIKPYNPVCIYLRRKNAKEAIDFAKTVKGEYWKKRIDEGLAQMGCSDLFQRRFDLELSLLASIHNIVCNIDGFDWSDAETKIHDFIV